MKTPLPIQLLSVAEITFLPPQKNLGVNETITFTVTVEGGGEGSKTSTCHFLDEHNVQNEAPRVHDAMMAGANSILRMPASQDLRRYAGQKFSQILGMALMGHDHRIRICLKISNIPNLLAAAMVSTICKEHGENRARAKVETQCADGYQVRLGPDLEVFQREAVYPKTATHRGDVAPIGHDLVKLN